MVLISVVSLSVGFFEVIVVLISVISLFVGFFELDCFLGLSLSILTIGSRFRNFPFSRILLDFDAEVFLRRKF